MMELYYDPCTIKATALHDLQSRLTGGEPIVDANNVPMFFLEKFSTIIANAMLSVKTEIDPLYKLRATTPEDLYKHMSDYDYVGLYATPSPFSIVLELEKSYLVYNARSYSDVYKRVVIPKNTTFTFGEYSFGIYYPIIININKRTSAVTVEWDLSEENKLNTLNSNSMDFFEGEEDGINLIRIHIPVFQFTRSVATETVTPDTGFVKTYTYTDKFYAVRAFNYNTESATWSELPVSLSETIYDITNPTVRFVINQDAQSVKIIVPPIYFTSGMITSQLKFEVYTTKGELNVDIESISASTVTHNFNIAASDMYSSVLDKMSSVIIYSGSPAIVGGTDGISLVELKKRVINNTFHGDVITTPGDIEKYFSNLGFKSTRYACNVTDMIYLCHKQLTNSREGVIAGGSIKTYISNLKLSDYASTILVNSDDSLTILPSTIYKYNPETNICVPLTSAELNTLNVKNKENKVLDYNSNTYTKSPFHIRLDRSTRYPIAYTYDLNEPTTKYLRTVTENPNSDYVIKTYAVNLTHDGVSGYKLKFLVAHTEGVTTSDVVLFFYLFSTNGTKIWAQAQYVTDYEDKWVYEIQIDTNYMLFENNTIYLNTLRSDSGNIGFEVPLEFESRIVVLVRSALLAVEALSTNVGYNVGSNFSTFTPILEQSVTITLGTYLSGLYNNVDVVYQEAIYLTYESDVYSVADRDIYQYDSQGNIVYTLDAQNNVQYVRLYAAGQTLLDTEGNPIIKHPAGTIRLNEYGQPIIDPNHARNMDYVIDMVQIDGKLDLVTDSNYTNIMDYTRSILRSYMVTINEAYDHLLNGTKLFFAPIKTIGMATSSIGNNLSITHSLELTVRFKLYVQDYVNKNETIKQTIYDNIVSLIDGYTNTSDDNVVAIDVIVSLIKQHLSEYVINVDVFGFFDDPGIQTLICSSGEIKPHLKQYLLLRDDGVITVARGLTIDFVVVN